MWFSHLGNLPTIVFNLLTFLVCYRCSGKYYAGLRYPVPYPHSSRRSIYISHHERRSAHFDRSGWHGDRSLFLCKANYWKSTRPKLNIVVSLLSNSLRCKLLVHFRAAGYIWAWRSQLPKIIKDRLLRQTSWTKVERHIAVVSCAVSYVAYYYVRHE